MSQQDNSNRESAVTVALKLEDLCPFLSYPFLPQQKIRETGGGSRERETPPTGAQAVGQAGQGGEEHGRGRDTDSLISDWVSPSYLLRVTIT